MTLDLARYDDVVHAIYDAALQPSRWPDVIERIAGVFDSPRGLLFTYAHAPAQGGFAFTHNITQATLEQWAAKSMHQDPIVNAAFAKGLLVEGGVAISSELVPSKELIATDFYRELWEPIDIAQCCSGVVFDNSDAHKLPTVLSAYRSAKEPAFIRRDADVLRRLLAHLSRSLGVMFHLRDSQLQLAASLAALNRLASGVVLIDGSRKIQFTNKMAESIAQRADTVMIGSADSSSPSRLRLHPRLWAYEARFQATIAQALQPLVQDATEHFSQAMLLPAEDGRPACVIHAAPLAESHGFTTGGSTPRAIVFLYDLDKAASIDPMLLCSLFEVTPAEARAALQITQGGGIEEMASRLGVTTNTFKTQLQSAYVKTGTHRQADLLKLLLALASR